MGATWTALPPASWCWPLPAKAIERISPWRLRAHQVDRRVLHRQLRAEVAVDPLHRRVLVRDGALGDEVVDVVRPVLDRRVAHPRARLGDDLDDRRVQRVGRVLRGGAALDVVHERALVGDDQRALELAHVLGVDPEVGLQRHLDVHSRRDVHERAARPDGRVERGELVVVGRDHGGPVLAHQVLVLAQARCPCRGTSRPASRGPRAPGGRRPRTRTARRRRPGTSAPPRECRACRRCS